MTPIDVAGALARGRDERGGRPRARVRVSSRLSAAGAAARSPAREARAQLCPRHAAAGTPLRSATSATMSRMIRSSSKSFGV